MEQTAGNTTEQPKHIENYEMKEYSIEMKRKMKIRGVTIKWGVDKTYAYLCFLISQ